MSSRFSIASAWLVATLAVTAFGVCLRATAAEPQTKPINLGERITFHSKVLDEDRSVLVGLPSGYRSSETRHPVLYVLDGEYFFLEAQAATQFLSTCTYLRTHPIPEMIVVAVVNVDRNRDYTPTHAPVQGPLRYPTSGGSPAFLRFLRSELVPLIDARFRTQPYRVLSGWSFGGLFTVHTFLHEPSAFSAYLAISPSLWWEQDAILDDVRSLVRKGALSPKPLVVTIGALEGGDMDRSVRRGLFPLLSTARSSGLAFTSIEIPGREHYYSPPDALFDGLRAVFSDWALPQAALDGGFDSVKRFYARLSLKVGYPVPVPESAYQALVGSLIGKGDDQTALKIARDCSGRYPASSRALRTLGVMLKRVGDRKAARATFLRAIEVEKALAEPDSERIMDVRLQLWLLDQEAKTGASTDR